MEKCIICGKMTDTYHQFDEGKLWPCCDTCYEDYLIMHEVEKED